MWLPALAIEEAGRDAVVLHVGEDRVGPFDPSDFIQRGQRGVKSFSTEFRSRDSMNGTQRKFGNRRG